jgi:hypothetical protein
VNDYDLVISGTNNAETDTTNMQAAAAVMNEQGFGTIYLEGDFHFNDDIEFTAPISLVGKNYAHITNDRTSGVLMHWNFAFDWNDLTSYSITGSEGDEYIASPNVTLSVGDWIVIWSEDAIEESMAHNYEDGGNTYPMHLHQVQAWDSGNSYAYLDTPLHEDFNTNAEVIVVPLQRQVTVANLIVEHNSAVAQGDYTQTFHFAKLEGLNVENILMPRLGSGAMAFNYCANARVSNCAINGQKGDDNVYGLLVQVVNGFLATGNVICGTRHGLTTGGGESSGYDRWGGAINTIIQGNVVKAPTYEDGTSRVMLDTHAEGNGILIQNNIIDIGSRAGANNIGIQSRCRGTIAKGNVITSKWSTGTAIRFYGGECVAEGNSIKHILYGVSTECSTWPDGYASNCRIVNNYFEDVRAAAIRLRHGDNHVVMGNHFNDVGSITVSGTTSPMEAAIHLGQGDGHQIRGNTFNKVDNLYAIGLNIPASDVSIQGNTMIGFADHDGVSRCGVGRMVEDFVASGQTCTLADHDLSVDDKVRAYQHNGTLPDPLNNLSYYYVTAATSSTFELSTTKGGTSITFTDAGSGHFCLRGHPAVYGETFLHNQGNDVALEDYKAATDLDTTPDVTATKVLIVGNTEATTITDFDGELHDGQVLRIVFTTGNTTVQDNASVNLNGSGNFTPASGGTLTLVYYSSEWFEVGRAAF